MKQFTVIDLLNLRVREISENLFVFSNRGGQFIFPIYDPVVFTPTSIDIAVIFYRGEGVCKLIDGGGAVPRYGVHVLENGWGVAIAQLPEGIDQSDAIASIDKAARDLVTKITPVTVDACAQKLSEAFLREALAKAIRKHDIYGHKLVYPLDWSVRLSRQQLRRYEELGMAAKQEISFTPPDPFGLIKVCGLPIVLDETIPSNIRFVDKNSSVMAEVVNLEVDESTEAA